MLLWWSILTSVKSLCKMTDALSSKIVKRKWSLPLKSYKISRKSILFTSWIKNSLSLQFKNLQEFQIAYCKNIKITKWSKDWWNEECQVNLSNYRSSKQIEDWKKFKHMVKKTKWIFFDNIQEITSKNQRSWNLMNWIRRKKLPAIETL